MVPVACTALQRRAFRAQPGAALQQQLSCPRRCLQESTISPTPPPPCTCLTPSAPILPLQLPTQTQSKICGSSNETMAARSDCRRRPNRSGWRFQTLPSMQQTRISKTKNYLRRLHRARPSSVATFSRTARRMTWAMTTHFSAPCAPTCGKTGRRGGRACWRQEVCRRYILQLVACSLYCLCTWLTILGQTSGFAVSGARR